MNKAGHPDGNRHARRARIASIKHGPAQAKKFLADMAIRNRKEANRKRKERQQERAHERAIARVEAKRVKPDPAFLKKIFG